LKEGVPTLSNNRDDCNQYNQAYCIEVIVIQTWKSS